MQLGEFAKGLWSEPLQDGRRLLLNLLARSLFQGVSKTLGQGFHVANVLRPSYNRSGSDDRILFRFRLHSQIELRILEIAAHQILLAKLVQHAPRGPFHLQRCDEAFAVLPGQ